MRKKNPSKSSSKIKAKGSSTEPAGPAGKNSAVIAGGTDNAAQNRPSNRLGAAEFIRLTRAELGRITWPTRKETTITTVMVFVMVAILSLFFFLVDQGLSYGIKILLG
jgi:preprotein translocase subunit SecE